MRVLVTGITGFAGSHLVDYILAEKKDVEVVGIQRWRSRTENVEHFLDKVRMVECDLRDASSVRDVLGDVRPDWIFHLAAQSFVPTSWTAPTESLYTNIIGQLNIFEAVKKLHIMPRIQLACSSEEYGMVYENDCRLRKPIHCAPYRPTR
jgi:GDP-4-dehydro-6-deoxy-D-mannose reductase